MVDIIYTQDKMFTRFIPLTKDGEYIYNEIAKRMEGVATVLTMDCDRVCKQIRKAGYSVRKAVKEDCASDEDIDQLLKQLEV